MDWSDVGKKLLDVAPALGTFFLGPVGGAAGGLVKLLGTELGLNPKEATPEKVLDVMNKNPEALEKIKTFELNHKLEIQRLILQRDVAYLQDRQDARKRQVKSEEALGKRDWNLYVLAYSYTGGFFVTISIMLYLLLNQKFPETVPQFVVFLLGNLFGALVAGVTAVIQYFFGSSKGSSEKTATMTKQFDQLTKVTKK